MRTWWAWASALALCVSPAVAQARDRGERGDVAERRHPSPERRGDRGERQSRDSNRDNGSSRESRGSVREYRDRPSWTPPQRQDRRSDGGWRSDRNARPDRRDAVPSFPRNDRGGRPFDYGRGSRDYGRTSRDNSGGSWNRNRNDGYSGGSWNRNRNDGYSGGSWNRGRNDRYSGGVWNRDRRDDRGWGGWTRDRRDDRYSYRAPRRVWPSFRFRPRYPSYYRYGYIHLHGYYFPRYYYDYDAYPTHASIRTFVEPSEAEVYVDGYYAGVADDFDGLFQRLNVEPGRHLITFRLEGYQTWSAEVFAAPDSTVKIRHDMMPGPSGPDYGPDYGDDPGRYDQGVSDSPAPYEDPGPYEETRPYEEPPQN